ncbi:hypothetical protein E2562_037590 [Oryza meyeriana var. granulata]|uniref:Uncharacterized protein n=1 Tax=Oryza meyeriana var. granulata TaxID=110450 RepID=A0A6G1E8J9_9ORYZ|nr:hypothetical protein E2562_037590 [Oryza meyeriana var. granulata]
MEEGSAKAHGKAGEATAATHGEKEMTKQEAKAGKAQAKADEHQERAEHRANATTGRHGTRVPLTGPHGHGHHHAPAAVDPAYPSAGAGTYPASDKYI